MNVFTFENVLLIVKKCTQFYYRFRVAKFVSFTASADHRVIDGAVGAEWMKVFKQNMEDPANIIL